MRGWRLTDNDTKNGRDEGSLILPNHPALANVPSGTRILIIATESSENGRQFPNDQFTGNQWLLYAGNGNLDTTTDPHFNLSKNDNLVLLADNIGIAFYSNASITPHTFGILSDGISE